ncbi:hypothetical protein [Acinetobacter stercoris]|uniref:Uncharacterized protein n=1 Tax=Acinetobacter stercoris TaxID=2126983 RepID=A0A2U3MYI7_9GAMM|nr:MULTISPECIES: hypothetical protein [Acinetobacter]SPL70506.1 hypothetical protein KPC_1684 [Acinetobacter stercoris]
MKIIPEQSTSLINTNTRPYLKLDKGAICFFILGMFLAAVIIHKFGIFPIA